MATLLSQSRNDDNGGSGSKQSVDAGTLRQLLEGSNAPRLIDVRTPAEFESAHIPGAYNVPLDALKEHRREIVERIDDDVVLLCAAGPRSKQAEEALSAAGLPNLRVLEGGIQAWEQVGGPLTRGRQRWALERQVRLVAGSLVFTSVLASTVLPPMKWLAAAVGGGLTYAAVSNSCAMGNLLSRLPYNRGTTVDPRKVIEELAASSRGMAAADR